MENYSDVIDGETSKVTTRKIATTSELTPTKIELMKDAAFGGFDDATPITPAENNGTKPGFGFDLASCTQGHINHFIPLSVQRGTRFAARNVGRLLLSMTPMCSVLCDDATGM
jgi:hypothetical protein